MSAKRGWLFLPAYPQDVRIWTFPGWQASELFGNDHPVTIEYCSGNGRWILEKALTHPQVNWVAVEKRCDRAHKIWIKAQGNALKNLFVVRAEALAFTRLYLPAQSVDAVYINFPDPWPKARHAKHRLIRSPFVAQLQRVVKWECPVIITTDDPTYCGQIVREMNEWSSCFPTPYYVTHWPEYGSSFFSELWQAKSRTIHYMQFIHGKKPIGAEGFEPPTHCSQSSCASQTALCSD